MKVSIHKITRMEFQEFADKYDLELEIRERGSGAKWPIYIHFKGVEVKDGSLLLGEYGNGRTLKEAVCNYAALISNKLLVKGAYTDQRKEIIAPNLYIDEETISDLYHKWSENNAI